MAWEVVTVEKKKGYITVMEGGKIYIHKKDFEQISKNTDKRHVQFLIDEEKNLLGIQLTDEENGVRKISETSQSISIQCKEITQKYNLKGKKEIQDIDEKNRIIIIKYQ